MNFLELTRARYSVRNYTDRLVEPEKLDYIFECVRMAPSAVNYQPWRFAVVTDPERLAALKTAYPREWIQTAPCIIVLVPTMRNHGTGNRMEKIMLTSIWA